MGPLRALNRRGWTLHELMVSLGVLSGVLSLAAHFASMQLRFFRAAGELTAARGQLGHAGAIVGRIIWAASAADGDIVAAQDSALEVQAPIGAAVVCASAPGRIVIPAPTGSRGNTLSAFGNAPDVGDRVAALFDDSLGTTWLTFRVASPPTAGDSCARFFAGATWALSLQEQVDIPPGAAIRFLRPLRMSLYRSSDGKWYLGAKDWNAEAERFNTVQPVAGPMRAYSVDGSRSGLRFLYRDEAGAELDEPIDTRRIATVTIVARSLTDSITSVVSLRNRR